MLCLFDLLFFGHGRLSPLFDMPLFGLGRLSPLFDMLLLELGRLSPLLYGVLGYSSTSRTQGFTHLPPGGAPGLIDGAEGLFGALTRP